MGNLLKKSWKKIFIIIGAIVLAFCLYLKIAWKPSVVNDYVESDLEIKSDVIDSIKGKSTDIANDAKVSAEKIDLTTRNDDGSRSIIGWGIILGVVVLGIFILDMLMQPKETKKKK